MNSSHRGNVETILLKQQVDNQLGRLFDQLEDLEELKDQLEDGEYAEEKQETLQQLQEFQVFLEKATSGDMTLVDEFAATQLAIQAAVSEAFKTPEVIRMFARNDSEQLRKRLASLKRETELKHMSKSDYTRQASEILIALKKMGVELTETETIFLNKLSASQQLEAVVDKLNATDLMSTAKEQISHAEEGKQ